jgi:hypothetical protein
MRLDRNVIFPENFKDEPKKLRGNKGFTILTTPAPKQEDKVRWNSCRFHPGTKLIRGFLCEFCGPTLPAMRIVDVIPYEKEEKSS